LSKGLVIVESPAKAKTIQKYLGKGFEVEASLGHVKDLPKSTLGVDVNRGFETDYVVIPGKEKVLAKLKKLAKDADAIYLAPDPDREGEAIAAHLAEELGGDEFSGKKKKKKKGDAVPRIQRVTFNEITQRAVREAFEHPREIDRHLVDAQQTRRVLDRLVGYQVSPLLWDKVRRGLSAGRVQTVALRLIVERDREIKAFEKKEYWTMDAHLASAKPPAFDARFVGKGEEKIEVSTAEEAENIRAALENADWVVRSVDRKERRRNAPAPFTTSKLQQDSSRKLRFSVKRTMMIAQRLYEGVELGEEGLVGLITYMRTDSTRVSGDALAEVRTLIGNDFGLQYLPETPNAHKSKKGAQEAHEAIRPTAVARHPESVKPYLKDDEYKVYKLIWQRFVASQINPAVFDQTTVDIDARKGNDNFWFRVTGSVLKFDGFLKVYEESKEGKDEEDEELKHKLPALDAGQKLTLKSLNPEQHFTEPPPRYNEATLVKALEEKGIGRPSTYATILSVIQNREYVQKQQGRFYPTDLGMVVNDLLVKNFSDIFDVAYTARMEEELDEVEEGKLGWIEALKEFYTKFKRDLRIAEQEMADIKGEGIPTEEKCEKCGRPMVIRLGRNGRFLACTGYPECDGTRDLPPELANGNGGAPAAPEVPEQNCEKCGKPMAVKRGRFGYFLACTGYPECRNTKKIVVGGEGIAKTVEDVPLEEKCPECGNHLVIKHGRFGKFTACSNYPTCKYVKRETIGVHCPEKDCTGELVVRRTRTRKTFYGCSRYPDCKFTAWDKPVAEPCPQCGYPILLEKTSKKGTRFRYCPSEICKFKKEMAP
jgi:DNA topoisomerase-1